MILQLFQIFNTKLLIFFYDTTGTLVVNLGLYDISY